MKKLIECPVCSSPDLRHSLSIKDHSVSHETFELQTCAVCGLGITNPRPDNESLSTYYKSDNYISHSGVSSGLINKSYLQARKYTLKWKRTLVDENSISPVTRLLDYGCGTGEFLQHCKSLAKQIYGVEPSELARAKSIQTTGEKIYATLDGLPLVNFDAITLWHVLEHIPALDEVLEELGHRLEKNGTIFLAVPNYASYDSEYYKSFWAGYDVPRHLWHFTPKNMKMLLNKNGFELEKTIPMKLDAYYISLMSEQYKNGAQSVSGMINAGRVAWKSNQKPEAQVTTQALSILREDDGQ